VAADNAYGNGSAGGRILTPYTGSLTSVQDFFSYFLSSLRIMEEQTFGVVVARWGILWSPLRCSLAKASKIFVLCCKLHNYIIDQRFKAEITAGGPSVPAVDPDTTPKVGPRCLCKTFYTSIQKRVGTCYKDLAISRGQDQP
jgi:DDE superfamily endonuclease